MPLRFSIVIPSYMQARWLEACMKSVLGQQGVQVQTIVMDGGSTDGSREIIERYAPHLAYWQSQKDGGQAAAIRAGFERADGDILGWLNSDDVLLPGALAQVAAFFEAHPQEEVVTGGGFYIDAEGQPYFWRRWRPSHTMGVAASHRRFLCHIPQEGVWQPSTFWRRSAYEAVGGVDPQFQYIMDFDLLTRLSARRRLARLPALLSCFRIHQGNKTYAWRDVAEREQRVWAAKHGVDLGHWRRRLWQMAYFCEAVLRRSWWWLKERSGALRLEAPHW